MRLIDHQGCSNPRCGHIAPDRVGLTIDDTDYGFCSLACFCIFVRSNYMESRSQGGEA